MRLSRRSFTATLAAGALGGLATPASLFAQQTGATGRVVIVGGGFGGATCAKYLRRANPGLDITLVESSPRYVTCPMSNTVIAGMNPLSAMNVSYDRLRDAYGINVVTDRATGVDADAGGGVIAFDDAETGGDAGRVEGRSADPDAARPDRSDGGWRHGSHHGSADAIPLSSGPL